MTLKSTAAAHGHIGGLIGGALGGAASTIAKRRTARANGKMGGRPKGKQDLPCRKCSAPTTERDASRRADCGC